MSTRPEAAGAPHEPEGQEWREESGDEEAVSARLHETLRERFGLLGFRGRQEEACTAVLGGQDTLIVMPTGAGKSLCYQLPGALRAGATLVISPLIALMEDQVAKLNELGFKAARIHSGRSRMESRQACIDYLEGELDFLYISPERLAVPRFGAFLARRRPALVAVDEAHCISNWGHDFRPDYRGLRRHLARLAETPVVALTATATRRVQDDIVEQLGLKSAKRVIHGFRRDNIAVEVVEAPPSDRVERMRRFLGDDEQRPAIVYVPTRRSAEETAAALGSDFPAAAYHAGMSNTQRDAVQAAFTSGELDVVVATSAFGMGIDKADVRAVVHGALPSSVEAYYQEIGRAGRDGKPSRAVLLHGFVDRRIQETLFERSYPAPDLLARIFRALGPAFTSIDELSTRLDLDRDTLGRALEQLAVHGGAERDGWSADVRRGADDEWRASYERQRALRAGELDGVLAFAQSGACRMATLVSHFGDRVDGQQPCGMCDVCDPEGCRVRRMRAPEPAEVELLALILEVARAKGGVAKGKLFRSLEEEGRVADRRSFEHALEALWREGLLRVEQDTFEKDGRTISYQRAHTTKEGASASHERLAEVRVDDELRSGAGGVARLKTVVRRRKAASRGAAAAIADDPDLDAALVERLRAWRREQAETRSVPAYRVLTNRSLEGVARDRPEDLASLEGVHGIGPRFLADYGEELLAVVARSG